MRHLVNFKDWTPKEVEFLIDMGIEIKREPEKYRIALQDTSLAMIFQKLDKCQSLGRFSVLD